LKRRTERDGAARFGNERANKTNGKKERLGEMENISVFDLVVTVLLATATFWGGMRGVVSQISSIATWVLSGLAAARYGSVVGEVVSIPEPWRAPVSALIVFCAALLALNVATRFVKPAVSLAGLKEFDRQTGALFGLIKGCAICVVLTFFCVLASEKTRDLVDDSKTGPYLASVSLLLKGAFPESETMTRFEELVGTMETTQAKKGETTLNSEIADLETYLKENVLSREAADVVEEAEAGTANGAASGWSQLLNDLRAWSGSREANRATPIDEGSGEEENEENGGGWEKWNVWENEEDSDVRGGAINDGYYSEYEEDARNGAWDAYNDDGDNYVETSSDWSDLATFLTDITGDALTTWGINRAESAASETLNEFLGAPTNVNANARYAEPSFDVSGGRTTDGAILGRPSATSTTLIPPLPY
jgi:uncharacterized membrane protein required for colicin V production